jgi:hypothetical protein
LREVRKDFARKDQERLRRHALKLAWFPDSGPDSGSVIDLDWSWVEGLPGNKRDVGELRIDEPIGGHRNLRMIFFLGDASFADPLPMIWILRVFPKKSYVFKTEDLDCFHARRTNVRIQYYSPS